LIQPEGVGRPRIYCSVRCRRRRNYEYERAKLAATRRARWEVERVEREEGFRREAERLKRAKEQQEALYTASRRASRPSKAPELEPPRFGVL
jgi:hypothetical protein